MKNSTFFNEALFGMDDGRRSLPIYDLRFTIYDLRFTICKIRRAELAGSGAKAEESGEAVREDD